MSDKLNMAIQQFFSTQPVLKACLFGSYSRKKERKNSDIDILIELEDGIDLFQFVMAGTKNDYIKYRISKSEEVLRISLFFTN